MSSSSLPSSDADEADLNGTPQPQRSGSVRNIVVSLLLSALVLAGVGYVTFDATAFHQLIQHLRPWLLVAATGTAFARLGLGGWRLRQVSEGRLGIWSGTRGQLAWDFFSSVTPSVVGGGPVAAFYVACDEDLSVGDSAALMFFCVLLDQLWFLVAIPLLVLAPFTIDLLPDVAGTMGLWGLLAYFGGLLAWSASTRTPRSCGLVCSRKLPTGASTGRTCAVSATRSYRRCAPTFGGRGTLGAGRRRWQRNPYSMGSRAAAPGVPSRGRTLRFCF